MQKDKKHHASMLRSSSTLHQGQGRTMYISRWGVYDNGREVGQIEVKVKLNKKGEPTTLAPNFTLKEV